MMEHLRQLQIISLIFLASTVNAADRMVAEGRRTTSDPIYVSTPTGRVGIGMTAPQHKLDVVGNASISSGVSVGQGLTASSGTFTQSGATSPSVRTSSGILLLAGVLDVSCAGCGVRYSDGITTSAATGGSGGGGGISGSGTEGSLAKFTGSTSIGDSSLKEQTGLTVQSSMTFLSQLVAGTTFQVKNGGVYISSFAIDGTKFFAYGSTFTFEGSHPRAQHMPYGYKTYPGSTGGVPNATQSIVDWDTDVVNQGGISTSTTGSAFLLSSTGRYCCICSIPFGASAVGDRVLYIVRSGTIVQTTEFPNNGSNILNVQASWCGDASGGSLMTCQVYHEAGTTLSIAGSANRRNFMCKKDIH